MPPKQKTSSATDSNVQDTDLILQYIFEMLNDDDVLRKLRLALYPQALVNKIDTLTQTIAELNMKLKKKSRIALKKRLIVLKVSVTTSNNILAGET